jgi:hypothetical protein
VDLEWKREGLRNSRWERQRSKIYMALTCVIFLGVAFWDGAGSRIWKLLPLF